MAGIFEGLEDRRRRAVIRPAATLRGSRPAWAFAWAFFTQALKPPSVNDRSGAAALQQESHIRERLLVVRLHFQIHALVFGMTENLLSVARSGSKTTERESRRV
jgi:hypothetical protein